MILRLAAFVLLQAAIVLAFEIPMRDGVRLSCDIYGADPAQPKPVLLARTPYDKTGLKQRAEQYARHGYVVVIQDCRGRYASQGAYVPYNNDKQDGYDTLDWIQRQSWSNGRVGMFGGSHLGVIQWLAAAENSPGLAAIAPAVAPSSLYRVSYRAGVLRLALISSGGTRANEPPPSQPLPSGIDLLHYHLPLLSAPLAKLEDAFGWSLPWMTSLLEHPVRDGFWNQTSGEEAIAASTIPVQILSGYYDFFHHDSVQDFERLRRRRPARPVQLILGPWTHGGNNRTKTQDVDFGPSAKFDEFAANLEWFERFVKRSSSTPFPLVRYFCMGDNRWFEADEWPPRATRSASFYLHSASRVDRMPPSSEQADNFISDPAKPTPSTPNDRQGISRSALWSPMDLTTATRRNDVLVYDSEPLRAHLRFAGPIRAELWGESDTPDVDWIVRVIDVRPDGFAMGLAQGIVRGRFRNSESQPEPLEPGRVYRLEVDLGSVAARLDAGHRLRIEVAGSSFPMYDRNLHTGKGPFDAESRVARQKVCHDTRYASRVILPVFPTAP